MAMIRQSARLLALLLVLSCSSQHELPRLSPDAVILAFGDSLTYGTGTTRDQAYPAVLSGLVGREVVNAGVPGEVTEEGLMRLPALLDDIRPALLILCHGGNDLIRNRGMDQAEANLRAMITEAQQRGVSVLLVAVPEPGILLSTPDFYESIAEDMRLPIENEILAELLSKRSLKSDTIHPNAAGYRLMAEALFRRLKEAGAL